ncbi:sulfotransferase family protein [Roseobacter sp. CCS2]|uniref:sulfotransferase family protein n=1 Tax=Roseobacter sp. CCS2 TaxID=391593 RepID=UPI0000F400F9|nr:sulfotransferase family protein [Roseobacter sp. CCS2]EBA13022.1 hypothetical protein RCCS2_04034 [Roseobacter sp. CCS2]
MRRLIVHIGQPKTGTTTLQSALLLSREVLLEEGILYPLPIAGNNHAHVASHFFGYEAAQFHIKEQHRENQGAVLAEGAIAWENILFEMQTHHPRTTIISAENLFGAQSFGNVDAFIAELKPYADELHFVAYIRSPADHYLSLHQQSLKHGALPGEPRKGSHNRNALEPYLNVNGVFLHVHPFDRDKMHGGDIVTDFFVKHLTPEALHAVTRPQTDQNTSISAEAMVILDHLRQKQLTSKLHYYRQHYREAARLVMHADNDLPGKTRPKYRPGVARMIFEAHQDLDWLETTFGLQFRPPDADPAADHRTLSDLRSVRALCHVDETRYQQLRRSVPSPHIAPLLSAGRKFKKAGKQPVRTLRRVLTLPIRRLRKLTGKT